VAYRSFAAMTIRGIVGSEPHRFKDRWRFLVWVPTMDREIECLSSATFEFQNLGAAFDVKANDAVELVGQQFRESEGKFFFDRAILITGP
jgi:hypothetical protein